MSKKWWILILFIVVIAAGWGIGMYTAPSASEGNGAISTQQPELQGEPVETSPTVEILEPTVEIPEPTVEIPEPSVDTPEPSVDVPESSSPDPTNTPATSKPATSTPATAKPATAKPAVSKPTDSGVEDPSLNGESVQTVAEPETLTVLVNKQYKLPDNYKPADLVYPEVPFIFSEKIEKRMMRKTAANALEEMFAGAKAEGVYLAGVSAFRSQSTQTTLFNNYVKRDGEAKARTYSAVPGHSEHQTGLAIDVSGRDGKCAADSCFAGTKEANWMAKHAPEYGFIIRFPEGKESITGYKYEPWHLRYVGTEIASSVQERGITLEEYYDAIPVSR